MSVALAEPGKVNPLGDLPGDVQVKIVQLAQILSGAIQGGQLSDVQIKALVIETQVFEVFAANSIHNLSRGNVWVIVTRNVAWRFIL